MAITDGELKEISPQTTERTVTCVAQVLLRDKNPDRTTVVATLFQDLGQLPVGLLMKSGLQGEPSQTRAGVFWLTKSVISETVDQQPTRLRPALLLVHESRNLCAGQVQHRTVFKFDVGKKQE